MTRRPVNLNKSQKIDEPLLHDADVTGIFKSGEGKDLDLQISLRGESGKNFSVLLKSVSSFNVQDFTSQNIVLDGEVYTGSGHLKILEEYQGQMNWSANGLKAIEESLSKGLNKIFILNPSVGCSIFALCASVEIEEQ